MKILAIILMLASSTAMADYDYYVKIGAGYKIDQTEYTTDIESGRKVYLHFNDPISARIEVGIEHESISYGISHHSNWLTGYPFNNEGEFHKTEIFVDYKFSW